MLSTAAIELAAAPLEFEALDVAWRSGRGGLLARCAGPQAARRAARAARLMADHGLTEVEVAGEDGQLWERQRAGQRSLSRRWPASPPRRASSPRCSTATDACDGTLVGRAALGHSFVELAPDALAELRSRLPAGAAAIVLRRSRQRPGHAAGLGRGDRRAGA